jgi:hypothetical protein
MPMLSREGHDHIWISDEVANAMAQIDMVHADHPDTRRIDWPQTASKQAREELECNALLHWMMQAGRVFRARYGRT